MTWGDSAPADDMLHDERGVEGTWWGGGWGGEGNMV